MLVRDAGDDWLLITQGDHARLAADLAAAIAEPPELPGGIVWADVVDAIRHHDDGWFELDAQSVWDPDRRRVRNFDEYSVPEATAIWRDSVRRVHALATQPAEWFDRRIDRRLYEWVWCGLSTATEPLTWEELTAKYIEQVGPPIPESGLREVVDAMCAAGIALHREARFSLNPWHRPRASLAALWVSSHFNALAELAEARHAEDFRQVAAARGFCTTTGGGLRQRKRRAPDSFRLMSLRNWRKSGSGPFSCSTGSVWSCVGGRRRFGNRSPSADGRRSTASSTGKRLPSALECSAS